MITDSLRIDDTAMAFDDSARDVETEARPVAFGCVERLEHAPECICIQSRPVIVDAYLHVSSSTRGHNLNVALGRLRVHRRVNCVGEQVNDHLLKLYGVTVNGRISAIQRVFHPDVSM